MGTEPSYWSTVTQSRNSGTKNQIASRTMSPKCLVKYYSFWFTTEFCLCSLCTIHSFITVVSNKMPLIFALAKSTFESFDRVNTFDKTTSVEGRLIKQASQMTAVGKPV